MVYSFFDISGQFECERYKFMKIAWINRSIEAEFTRVRDEYPVVTITGPRQSGKTSLAKRYCDGYAYANLESPEIRKLAQSDPKAFFSAYPAPVIIDEIQRVPELLSYIQVFADATSQRGQYILTRKITRSACRSAGACRIVYGLGG